MIAPQTAQRLVVRHSRVLEAEQAAIDRALGCVLAEDVRAPIPLPTFDNSAMDGFAVRSRDTRRASRRHPAILRIVGTTFAGDTARHRLATGEARGIMTGAPLPRGADAVIAQEDAIVDGRMLRIERPVARLRHVRKRGEEIRRGSLVLRRGSTIHPGTVACLAALGRDRVRVIRRPRVAIITTGDETVQPGQRLSYGQIYDSNSHMAVAMLRDVGIDPVLVRRVKDRRAPLARAVNTALKKSDVLVVFGGVSVGKHDYLRAVLEDERVKTVFWRVRQKPGKPIYFGKKGDRLVFGLPGNPASAFTCYYMYVYPALRRMAGFRDTRLPRRVLPVTETIAADPKRWLLLKGKSRARRRPGVAKLPRQGSHMVTSLDEADSLIVVPATERPIKRGCKVVTYRLPYSTEKER